MKRVPALGYGHQGSCRSDICTLQHLSYPGCFASSFCQLYRKYRHALGTFIFTRLSKETVKWITCGTSVYSTKINKTQPQDDFLVFKSTRVLTDAALVKILAQMTTLPVRTLTVSSSMQCQGSYLAANTPWTSHLPSQLGEWDSGTKAALTEQLRKLQQHCQVSNFVSRFMTKNKSY